MDHASGERRLAGESGPEPPLTDAVELVAHSRELDDVSFGAITDRTDEARIQWATPDGLEIVGRGIAARFSASGTGRFDRVRENAMQTFGTLEYDGPVAARPRAFGGVAFHDGHTDRPPWTGFDAASFVIPEFFVTRSDDTTWLTTVGPDDRTTVDRLEACQEYLANLPAMTPSGTAPGVVQTRRTTSKADWTAQVDAALDRIDAGTLTKVVLAQALEVELGGPIDVPATVERLRRQYPNCYRFLIGNEIGGTFFGAPPERLVSKQGRHVETEALAGSVPRGETLAEDDAYADRMLADEKFAHEHDLVVESIREQLEPLASTLTVTERTVRRLATIQHLRTPISATLTDDSHILDLVEALHPTPAVGGVPPAMAWETIRETERFDRGWYAAPVGWFDAEGDGEFAVAIRSGLATGETVTLFAGNGIVADSDPAEEWDEVQLKFRPILDELR